MRKCMRPSTESGSGWAAGHVFGACELEFGLARPPDDVRSTGGLMRDVAIRPQRIGAPLLPAGLIRDRFKPVAAVLAGVAAGLLVVFSLQLAAAIVLLV